MTKRELANELAECMENVDGFGQSAANHAVETIVEIIAEALVRGEAVTLRRFATLEPVQRKARKARHINDGITIEMPAYRDVRMKLYGEMKRRMNEKSK